MVRHTLSLSLLTVPNYTLESWSNGIARMIVETRKAFIISTSFTFLNMFIAVFTNTMATVDVEDNDEHGVSKIYNDIMTELNEIKSHLNIINSQQEQE